ncbi:MAG: hypothetical protein M1818_007134 [Claussenomyces sp. TS43310]|nr:MAG: hypothetical protein M1818_007134 [Claussenomyces sp. TS43310]
MCVVEIYIDRYPNGREKHFRQTRLCQDGHPGRACGRLSTLTHPPREIHFDEPTSEFLVTQIHTPRSSTSSQRPTSLIEVVDIDERPSSPRDRRNRESFWLNAFFGEPPRRRRRGRQEHIVVIDEPPSPRISPPMSPPPVPYFLPNVHRYSSPLTPSHYTQDSLSRGRVAPVVIEGSRRTQRTTSIEVNIGSRRQRSPSPTLSDLERLEEEAERERRHKRDERAERLAREIFEVREKRERQERRARLDAEINARPAIPATMRRLRERPIVNQTMRLHEVLGDMHLSANGERVMGESIAERRREDERRASERRRMEERARMVELGRRVEEEEAQRNRLRRRFTVGGAASGRARHRVTYDDGAFRYE